MDFTLLKNQLEDFIRRGDIAKAKNDIEAIAPSSLPREWAASFADIARRVRSENWGLRVLRPIVRAEPAVQPKLTDEELCTYAGLLIKMGTLPEAKQILEQLDENKNVNVLIFLSQIAIVQWNYRESIPYLKKVQNSKSIDPYARCIAQVNLAAAFSFLQKYSEVKNTLRDILVQCRQNNWDLLFGNALEISAQLAIAEQNWPEASRYLQEAEVRAGQHSHYMNIIEKWRAISELLQTKPNSPEGDQIIAKIEKLRKKAQFLKSWESVRDYDFHIALHLNHQNLLLNVYFGTPHSEFKKRIEKIFKQKKWTIPNSYFRKLSELPADRVLDLVSGKEESTELVEPLKPGQMLHRALNILALDFYKPIGVGEFFSKLFPVEYFNPDVSSDRVSQAVKQLRKWFLINNIPLDIEVENNRYALVATGPYAFKISKKVQKLQDFQESGFEVQLKQLKDKWPYQSFSAKRAASELQVSPSSVRIILQRALSQKLIYKFGAGRSILYSFRK